MAEDSPHGAKDIKPRRAQDAAPPPPKKPEGFVQRLAQRSAGLQRPEAENERARKDAEDARRMWRLAGVGLEMAGTVAIAVFLGRLIDEHYHWQAAATITLTAVSLIGSFYLLIKESRK